MPRRLDMSALKNKTLRACSGKKLGEKIQNQIFLQISVRKKICFLQKLEKIFEKNFYLKILLVLVQNRPTPKRSHLIVTI